MNKTKHAIPIILGVAVLGLLLAIGIQRAMVSRRNHHIDSLTEELVAAKRDLDAERRRGARLDRRLKDAAWAARVSSPNSRQSEATAAALVDNYHKVVARTRSNEQPAKQQFEQFIAAHGLAAEMPEQDKQALLTGIENEQDPNRVMAAASFQDVDAAIATLLDVVARDPDNTTAWAALARRSVSSPEAGETFAKAITEMMVLDPNNAYPHHLQAIRNWKDGNLTEAYEAIQTASACDRYDDYQIEQIAYRDALLQDFGYSAGVAKHLSIQGEWSQMSRMADRKGLAQSLADFAQDMQSEGKADLAEAAYECVSKYASRLVGDSWTIADEFAALAIKKQALQGLLQSQSSLEQDELVAATRRSLGETEDRMARIHDITSRMSASTKAFFDTIAKSDSGMAAYYDNVLKYGEARAVEIALNGVEKKP